MNLHPAEKICAGIIATLLVFDAILIPVRGVGVDWTNYALMSAIGLTAIGVGQFYRTVRPEEKIALAATASGLFILFTIVGSVFNYLLLPVGELHDMAFIVLDRAFGFQWLDFLNATAEVPLLSPILRVVYASSQMQLILVVLLLGFRGEARNLHQFLLCGMISALIAILIWWMFPNSTPAAYYVLSDETARIVQPAVDHTYGLELVRLAKEGVRFISPRDTLGLISFPSFHTVMACLSVWFTRRIHYLFPIFVVINILMIPAIIIQGGHNLVDVIAGVAVFATALFSARAMLGTIKSSAQGVFATT
ncbi:PAP2 superfamily protein [Phyllobacterium sp. OV277]|nr:PAP2 superfamily protein [Phyllobacterium sp. OV277]